MGKNMGKNRETRTIVEKWGNPNLDKQGLNDIQIDFSTKKDEYFKKNQGTIEDFFKDTNAFYKGIFYVEALGRYDFDAMSHEQPNGKVDDNGNWCGDYMKCDAWLIQDDDHQSATVILDSNNNHKNKAKGETDYMEYVKFYVIEVSKDGNYLLAHNSSFGTTDYIFGNKNIIITGNKGHLNDK